MKYCPKCGTPTDDTTMFCAACGTKIDSQAAAPAAKAAPASKAAGSSDFKKYCTPAYVLMLIGVLQIIFFFLPILSVSGYFGVSPSMATFGGTVNESVMGYSYSQELPAYSFLYIVLLIFPIAVIAISFFNKKFTETIFGAIIAILGFLDIIFYVILVFACNNYYLGGYGSITFWFVLDVLWAVIVCAAGVLFALKMLKLNANLTEKPQLEKPDFDTIRNEAKALGQNVSDSVKKTAENVQSKVAKNEEEASASQFCPSCGGKVEAGTAFCPHCGNKIQ